MSSLSPPKKVSSIEAKVVVLGSQGRSIDQAVNSFYALQIYSMVDSKSACTSIIIVGSGAWLLAFSLGLGKACRIVFWDNNPFQLQREAASLAHPEHA